MKKNLFLKGLLYGFLSWAVPFAVSFIFYRPGGTIISNDMFRSVMIATAAISGAFFLYRYFKNVQQNYMLNGFTIGIGWFLLAMVLDYALLLPIIGISFGIYFKSIAMRYIILPAMSIAMGFLLQKRYKRSPSL